MFSSSSSSSVLHSPNRRSDPPLPSAKTMAAPSSSLKEYLKKYQSPSDDQSTKKKKKKKSKPTPNPAAAGVLVVDEDPIWAKPIQQDAEDEESDEDLPQVNEDIEVKRMKRLEAIRSRKPYHAISDDGSGWVSVSDLPINTDISPPRQRRPRRLDTPSPDRGQNLEDSRSGDLSPPRRRSNAPPSPERDVEQDGDMSPPRRNRNRNRNQSPGDLSPPRKGMTRSSSSEAYQSPSRNGRNRSAEADLSPPRKSRKLGDESSRGGTPASDILLPRRKREPSLAKEFSKTGLLSAEEIRKDNEKKRKEEIARFASMDASLSGKGAEPVFRDREGKRIKKEDLLKAQEEEEEKAKAKEKKLEWGKGLAQKREAEARAQELELEKEKPFARTRDDPELDKMLKQRLRWGDPMAHLVKKNSETLLEDLGRDEKMQASGFIIPQTVPNHSWIKRGVDFPPNRYGIRPGRHWDGIDRSNGYEKELFKRQSEKRATETEAYLWSVADM